MLPIIKIRLIYLKRNLFKNLFQFLYPVIFTAVITMIFTKLFSKEVIPEKKQHSSSVFSLFSPDSIAPITYGQFGIICKNDTIRELFADYASKHICNEMTECELKSFQTRRLFKRYIKSPTYAIDKEFDTVIEIEGKDPKQLKFNLKSKDMKVKSKYDTANTLIFQTMMTERYDNIQKWKNFELLISNFLIKINNITQTKNITIYEKPLTTPPIYNIFSSEQIITTIPMCLSISYSSTLFAFVLWMVAEKEKRLNDFLFRQGISHSKYLLSWFLTFILITTIPTLCTSYLLYRYLFVHTSFFLIAISQLLFTINIFGMSFLFQSFVKTVQTGQTILKVVYLGVTILSNAIIRPEVPLIAKCILAIFPQITQLANFELLLILDNYPNGIDYTLLTTPYNQITLSNTFTIYCFTFFAYILVATVMASYENSGMDCLSYMKYMIKQFKNAGYKALEERDNADNEFQNEFDIQSGLKVQHEELSVENTENKKNKKYLSINNISKYYGDLTAVNNFNGELYPNEIFCLLGHNGAGKTTLIKMISGLESPEKGDILLNGTSLITNKKYLYKNIGLCAQEDIFFDYLTVTEHLQLMCEIKGESANMAEINQLITKIDLVDKKDAITSTLSGGQKRKLCIALAITGNSKLILLDEPTSGMDIIAKRALWDFLKEYKQNKIMILTTHSLDEAEYLGDRIGIMSEGKFICSGTSSYLKAQYPCGYNVNLIFDSKEKEDKNKRITLFEEVKKIDGTALIKIYSKTVLSINCMNMNNRVKDIFNLIDREKENYGIESYTVSTTSLEDVFLKLNNNELSNNMFNRNDDCDNRTTNSVITVNSFEHNNPQPNTGKSYSFTFCNQLKADIKRTIIPLWRNKSNFILEIFAASATIFIYILGFNSQLSQNNFSYQSLGYLIQNTKIYYLMPFEYYTILTNSYYVKKGLSSETHLKEIEYDLPPTYTIDDIDDVMYNNHPYKNERNVIVVKELNNSSIEIYNLYQSISPDYYQASMNMLLSALFENDYNIQLNICDRYSNIPSGSKGRGTEELEKLFLVIMSIFMIWNSMISLSGYMITNPLKERINNVKHLLYLSGVNMYSYWIATLIVDFIKYLIFIIIVIPLLIWLDRQYWYDLIIFIPFIFAVSVFIYSFSFVFDKEENGQKYYILFSLLASIVLPFSTYFRNKDVFLIKFKSTDFIYSECDLIPTASLLIAMFRICLISTDPFTDEPKNLLWVVFNHSVLLLGQYVVYSLVLIFLEKRIIGKVVNYILIHTVFRFSKHPVSVEIENGMPNTKIEMSNNTSMLTTKIKNLSKTFFVCCGKNVKAVRHLNLNLEANEKFGLLGFNGSGKTTTFQCITNELFYDEGTINLFGYDTYKDFDYIRTIIGYCPQENALFDYLTVKETITYFKSLKGVNESVYEISEKYGLSKYLLTVCTHLSGGNKRKLAFAIAMMNSPKILLLDEPSTGVDPESRRIMWKNINSLSKKKNSEYNMILSTHSMEEAEILCDIVSWLKNGEFACVGNPEKLKLKFSAGYYLHVKFCNRGSDIETTNQEKEIVKKELCELIEGKELIEKAIEENGMVCKYMKKLIDIVRQIRKDCDRIEVKEINYNSYELLIHVKNDGQGDLFGVILNMKNDENEQISEISINMESLENILTKC